MASDVSDEGSTTVRLPEELGEWVDQKATELGVEEETVVVHLLAAYRAVESSGDVDPADLFEGAEGVEADLQEALATHFPVIAAAVDETLGGGDGADLEATEERLSAEIERVESEFADKLTDVRERVIQVKRETDAKADAERTDERLTDLAAAVERLETELETVDSRTEDGDTAERLDALESRVADLEELEERFESLEERLRTVAWVVSDLRDERASESDKTRAIDRLKRSAAEADIDRAVCEHCSEPVTIGLLTEAACPHCEAAVTDVQPAGGFFGKAKLTGPEQLESGTEEDRSDDGGGEP